MSKVELALRKLLGETGLTLSDTADEAVAGKIEALAAELQGLRSRAAEVETMKLAAEMAKNNICRAAEAALLLLSSEHLEKTLAVLADNAAVPGRLPKAVSEDNEDEEALTPAEEKMARRMNLSKEEYRNSQKTCKG